MQSFKIKIYDGKSTHSPLKWDKSGVNDEWKKFSTFYYDGNDSVVSLELDHIWNHVVSNQLPEYQTQHTSTEEIGQYPKLSYIERTFTIHITAIY